MTIHPAEASIPQQATDTNSRRSAPAAPAPSRLRKYRPDIQGLRAVAIAMVVVMHCGILGIHGGVDISFVLSGFLIGGQVLGELEKTGKVSLGKFWARRFRRLAPGMSVVILAAATAAWVFGSPLRFRQVAEDGLASTLSVMNWRLVQTGTDYFANNGTQSPYQHFWSLGIEEQFYLAAPIALFLTFWLSKAIFKNRVLVGLFLVTVIGGSLYLSITQTKSNQPLAYFGTQARIWELAFGILLALCAKQLSRMNQAFAAVVSWVGLAFAITTALLITESTPLPGYAVGGPVLGAGMIIAGGCAAPRLGVERLIANPVFNSVANVSYGWYLWHWPLLILWPDITGHAMTYQDRFRVASLGLVLAYGSFYVVEKRFRINAELVRRPWKGILTGITVLSITATATYAATTVIPLNIATSSTPVATAGTTGYKSSASVINAALVKQMSPTTLAELPNAPHDETHYGCIDNTDVTSFVMRSNCVIGDTKGKKTMVIIGDSHAWQWGDAMNRLGLQLHVRVVTMAKGGCSPEAYAIKNPQLNREYSECDSWRNSAFAQIKKLKPALVLVTSRIREETTEAGAVKTFKTLAATGSKLLYFNDSPQPGQNVPDCLSTHTNDISACNPSVGDALQFPAFRALEQQVAQRYGAHIFNVLPAFCTDKVCPTVISDQIVYFDNSHMTAGYATSLVPFIEPTIKKLLGV